MRYLAISWGCYAISCDIVGYRAISRDIIGILCDILRYHGISRDILRYHGDNMGYRAIPRDIAPYRDISRGPPPSGDRLLAPALPNLRRDAGHRRGQLPGPLRTRAQGGDPPPASHACP